MCEWLSQREWCDVKLVCGSHSFSAHRAVLASVSKFLRRILLSCPFDETPTYIVLPDFDLEAMSSVLYYVYNGEVIIPKHKLGLFLDIVQAMQIYIDCQYLPKIRETIEEETFDFNSSYDENVLKKEIFTLRLSDEDQQFLNIRKGKELQRMIVQYSESKPDFPDYIVRCQNGSNHCKSRLGNLKSYGDRQRNSFLRDLFIETYPRNGNVNGLTESVLAISNECYRSPASVLSTNANGKHLVGDDALTLFSTKITQHSSNLPTIFHSEQQQEYINDFGGKMTSKVPPCIKCPSGSSDMTFIYGNSESIPKHPIDMIPLLPQQLQDSSLLFGINTSSLNVRQSIIGAMNYHSVHNSENSLLRCDKEDKSINSKSSQYPKAIFNQVLENPWSPRRPIDYKPFRRKHERSDNQTLTVEKVGVMNDNNNNIQVAETRESGEQLTSRLSFETTESMSLGSATNICPENIKCTHCNQVFTSSESLAVHTRRHSSNARYTCGECGKTFSQLRNFKYHMSIHRGTREFAATCTVCGKYFNDRGYLSSHMKIHRNRKEYKCSLCPKSFNQRVAYNMHVRIHTGVKPHVCEECGKAFSRKMLLKQHQRTHSGERPYACPHCDKRFADRSNMTLHLRLHTGIKPFSCSLCPKSFTKKHHLKSHLNFHTGSKPYSCPRCKLAFTQSSNMRTHLKKCNAPDTTSNNESHSNM